MAPHSEATVEATDLRPWNTAPEKTVFSPGRHDSQPVKTRR